MIKIVFLPLFFTLISSVNVNVQRPKIFTNYSTIRNRNLPKN